MDAVILLQVLGLAIGAAILGVMLYWTRLFAGALRLAREAAGAAREASERQFQALSTPYVLTDFSSAPDRKVRITVSNPGALPAFNVSLVIVARYEEAHTPVSPFARTYVREAFAAPWLQPPPHDGGDAAAGAFGVVCERHHAVIPPRRKVTYTMDLPVAPPSIYALTQHEDVVGVNYGCLWSFDAATSDEGLPEGGYGLTARRPQTVRPSGRVHVREHDGRFVVAGDGAAARTPGARPASVPAFVQDDGFLAALRRALPQHHLKRAPLVFAGPARWDDV